MKRVALVTTWQEKCGIAHYSSFLKRALERYVDVEPIPLPRETVQDEFDAKKGDAYITGVVKRVAEFDAVIIQFEPGIFGRNLKIIDRRFRQIVQNSKILIVTFHHSVRTGVFPSFIELAVAIKRRSGGGAIRWFLACNQFRRQRNIFKRIADHARHYKTTVIVHTKRDAGVLRCLLPGVTVLDHPLSYMAEDYLDSFDNVVSRSNIGMRLPEVGPEIRFIGIFGFYAPNKSFETAIRAMRLLPDNLHLLVVSGIHEATLRIGEGTNSYLKSLLVLVEELKLTSRVHFIGSVDDDDLLVCMKLCDAAVMPYTNSGHSASGPANQVIELDRPTFVSRSLHFIEMEKYFPDIFEMFDIGNHIELAQKIARSPKGTDRIVNNLRLVEFPRLPRRFCIETAVDEYLCAIGVERNIGSAATAASPAKPAARTNSAGARVTIGSSAKQARTITLSDPLAAERALPPPVYLGDRRLLAKTKWGGWLVVPSYNMDVTIGVVRDGIIEPWTTRVVQDLLKAGQIAINVGAHFGYYSILDAQIVGASGKVFAIEANPHLIPFLMMSTFYSGVSDRVLVHWCAAWDRSGQQLEFTAAPPFMGGASATELWAGDKGGRHPAFIGEALWDDRYAQIATRGGSKVDHANERCISFKVATRTIDDICAEIPQAH